MSGGGRETKGKISGRTYSLANAKDFTKELVAATPSQRNWKGILIALLVICGVLGLIVFSIYLLLPPDEGPRVKGRKVTLNDVASSHFKVDPFNGSWISEKELLFRDQLEGLTLLNVEFLSTKPFIANMTFRRLDAHKFFVSPNRRFILFAHDVRDHWKHSFLAKYTTYDVNTDVVSPLRPSSLSERKGQPLLQWAGWVPGTSSLVFVYENNLYFKPDPQKTRTSQITRDGQSGLIYNGIPDWLYEAEILKSNSASWTSPNGEFLMYATFNDSLVGTASYHWYGDGSAYPNLKTIRYPKAGTQIPDVAMSVVNLRTTLMNSIPLKPPKQMIEEKEFYVTGVKWINDQVVSVVWMNRVHNHSVISLCKESNRWECRELYTVKNHGTGWLDFIDPPIFSRDGKSCLLRIPWRDGNAGYFRHVVLLEVSSRKELPLTLGHYEVTEILSWDQRNHYIYFIAAPEGAAGQRHLYRASTKSTNATHMEAPVCLSCPEAPTVEPVSETNPSKSVNPSHHNHGSNSYFAPQQLIPLSTTSDGSMAPHANLTGFETMVISKKEEFPPGSSSYTHRQFLLKLPHCLYNKVTFSADSRFFVRECLGPGVPIVTLHKAPSGRLLYILNNHTALGEEVANIGLPILRTFMVQVDEEYRAPVKLYLPPGLREEEEFKFPLILHVNGEPGSQLVEERWSLTWNAYLVSQKNYIIAEIDGRGSGFQGEANRHAVYKNLGSREVEDQILALRDLTSRLHFIDQDNMAVLGWGYGGYVAAHLMAMDEERREQKVKKLFRCGIIIAPVVRWEFQDTVYAERFMGLPNMTDNFRGYENSDLTQVTEKLRHKKLLIIHGTADNLVHYQNTLVFTKSLVKHGVAFSEQIYPDEGHLLSGALEHVLNTTETFLQDNFDQLDWEDYEKANFLGIHM